MELWNTAKRKLISAAWNTIQKSGYSIRKRESDAYPDQLRLLDKVIVQTIFDIGANCGDTVAEYRSHYPNASIHAFEAIPSISEQLQKRFSEDTLCTINTVAVSEKIGTARFNVNNAIDTSSLLETDLSNVPDSYKNLQSPVKVLNVPTTTIDNYCEEHQIQKIDILKLDIQGGELAALQGAESMLSKQAISLIYSEVFFLPFYRDQPLFTDIFAQVSKFGYSLHNLYNLSFRSTSGRCSWADVIFVSNNTRNTSRSMLNQDINS